MKLQGRREGASGRVHLWNLPRAPDAALKGSLRRPRPPLIAVRCRLKTLPPHVRHIGDTLPTQVQEDKLGSNCAYALIEADNSIDRRSR